MISDDDDGDEQEDNSYYKTNKQTKNKHVGCDDDNEQGEQGHYNENTNKRMYLISIAAFNCFSTTTN